MEKLIELLNEYEDTDNWENWHQVEFRESKIISKSYWFIVWLVENDKISYKKLLENSNFIEIKSIGWGIAYSLTMLLSIQDKPIELLISILK